MIDVLQTMQWYSLNFLGKLGDWLVSDPVVLIFVVLGLASSLFLLVRKMVS